MSTSTPSDRPGDTARRQIVAEDPTRVAEPAEPLSTLDRARQPSTPTTGDADA